MRVFFTHAGWLVGCWEEACGDVRVGYGMAFQRRPAIVLGVVLERSRHSAVMGEAVCSNRHLERSVSIQLSREWRPGSDHNFEIVSGRLQYRRFASSIGRHQFAEPLVQGAPPSSSSAIARMAQSVVDLFKYGGS